MRKAATDKLQSLPVDVKNLPFKRWTSGAIALRGSTFVGFTLKEWIFHGFVESF